MLHTTKKGVGKRVSYIIAPLIAILGFIIGPNYVEATYTFRWTSNFTNGSSTIDLLAAYPNQAASHAIHFDFTYFTQFTELNDVNFIDLKLSQGTIDDPNENIYLVICTSLSHPGLFDVCNSSTVIATSTAFTSQDIYDNTNPTTGFYRIYFNQPWDFTSSPGTHLYLQMWPTISPSYNPQVYINYANECNYQKARIYYNYGAGIDYQCRTTPIRFGYDNFQDNAYIITNEATIISSDTFTHDVSFSVPQNIASLYDSLWLEAKIDVTTYTGAHEYYSYTEDFTNTAGIKTSNFEITVDTPGRVLLYDISIYGEIDDVPQDPFLRASDWAFLLGTTSVPLYAGLEDYVGSSYIPLTGTSTDLMELCSKEAWTSGNWGFTNVIDCLVGIIVPSDSQWKSMVNYATSTTFTAPPLGYVARFFTLLTTNQGTTTLPSIDLEIPNGLPGSGKHLILTPWNHIRNVFYYNPSGNFISTTSTMTLWEAIKTPWELICTIFFGLWFIRMIIKFNP